MITFRRIPTVAVGDPVTAVEHIAMANGINDRMLSGLGDPTRRIQYFLSSASRQIRNPDSSGFLFPPVDEFRAGYEHVKPSDYQWPLTSADNPEGTNVSSILGAFVFGNEILDVDSEDIRLSDPLEGGVDMDFGSGTAREIWELAKRQRGAIDLSSGAVASPVFHAAKSHFSIIQSARSPHGNAYGGYVPTPQYLGSCVDPDEDGTYELIFTPIVDGLPTRTFEGYCASEPSNVKFIRRFPGDRYEIVQNDGTVTRLKWNEYIEGPYTFGNRLVKTWGNHINRFLNFFASQFHGTDAQRKDEDQNNSPWLSHAFSTHEFLTSQYHLAPQRGVGDGDVVSPDYPQWQMTGATSFPVGTVFPRSNGPGTTHVTSDGCVCASVFVHTQGLVGSSTIDVMDGTEIVESVELTPDSPSQIVTLSPARKMGSLTFVAKTPVQLLSAGTSHGIVCEATELWEYKPALWDLALLLRLCGARMELENGTDGSGLDEDQSAEISQDYFGSGVIVNRRLHIALPGSMAEINTNAVFEAARKYGRQCARLVPRENLVGYEVTAEGKSILYFRRLWMGNDSADVFDGIAPARDPIATGALEVGRMYDVLDGPVTYNGMTYSVGQKFTAVDGNLEYQTTTGNVYETNGILPDALPQKWSNEWVMDVLSLIPYQNLDTSVWKVSTFTDYVSWAFDRCTWQHSTPVPRELTWHFSYGNPDWVAPESFPSFRYVGSKAIYPSSSGINDLPCAAADATCEEARRRKLRSCPVGEVPLYVESTERLIEDGQELVKVTLSGRLQHGSDAPATVDRDLTTWNLATIQAEIESGRTAENGIREYLINQFVGGDCVGPGTQYGNAAHRSNVATSLDVPFGACFPRIGFTRLVPKPYWDGEVNNSPDKTPMESWIFPMIELYARSMCEGYVDTVSTEQYGCATGTYAVLDLTFETAAFRGFGGRAFGCIQSEETELAPIEEVRPDKPLFHGGLPNTYPSAEIFNQFATFFNLLKEVRLMLPVSFKVAEGNSQTVEIKKLHKADGMDVSCTTSQVNPGVYGNFGSVEPPAPVLGGYSDAAFASATYHKAIDDFSCDGSGDWRLVHSRFDSQFKWKLVHNDYLEAVPVQWRGMIDSNGLLLGIRETVVSWEAAENVSTPDGESCNGIGDFWSGSGGEIVRFNTQTESATECKLLPFSERLVAPLPPTSAVGVGRVFDAGDLIYCVVNANSSVVVTPVPADALIIRVELVDQ